METPSPPPVVYTPLDVDKKEIRLLQLLPLSPADKATVSASCRLSTVSLLNDKPSFKALSYVWGDASVTGAIMLDGVRWEVTSNLAAALRCLTPHYEDSSRLWVDAVCINQNDLHERQHQVSLMGDIYSSAAVVCAWLGSDPCIPLALDTLGIINKEAAILAEANKQAGKNKRLWLYRHYDLYVEDCPCDERTFIPNRRWSALYQFAQLEYWSRMWIFQEIVLSRGGLVFVNPAGPDRSVSHDELTKALSNIPALAQCLLGSSCPDYISATMWRHLKRLGDLSKIFTLPLGRLQARSYLGSQAAGADLTARTLLSAFNYNAKATDPRDYYYSILGVSRLPLKPDYSPDKTVEEVCLDFVEAYLAAASATPWALLFLYDAVGASYVGVVGRKKLPSWAPGYHLPLTHRIQDPDPDARADRGVFDNDNNNNNANHNINNINMNPPAAAAARPRPAVSRGRRRLLRVLGVRVTAVSCVWNMPSVQSLMSPVAWPNVNDRALLAAVARRQDGGHAIRRRFQTLGYYADAMPLHADDDGDGSGARKSQLEWAHTLAEYERLGDGRLFETEGEGEDGGYLGSAPRDVREDDLVCVLDGFMYPVVLRPAGGKKYIFVGPCYVLGLMMGEAAGLVEGGQARPEVFFLT